MEPQIKGHDVHVGEHLRELVTKKTARLDRYLPQWAVVDAKIEFHERHARGGPQKLVEFTIAARGAVLRAEATAPDFAAALDEAVDRMARQIVRYRSRWRDRQRQPAGEPALPELPAEAGEMVNALRDEAAESGATLVRTKRFAVKPMVVEEAIEQMELLGHDFFVFYNQEDRQTNVVYRRREGGYGLLQPQIG